MIHPTAIIHPMAQLSGDAEIGAYSIIDEGVKIGPGCIVGPHVHITGQTEIGVSNRFHTGCVIGDAPQDLKYKGEPTGLRIGDRNVFREHVTVHRSTRPGEFTVIGSDNFLMANCHAGHNSRVGSHVIIANGALLAGHVSVDDRAFISGNCLIHQFTRVGTLALMQGGSAISKDLPPFAIARGDNGICGLNVVGLRRAGIAGPERLDLKRLYHFLFRSGRKMREAVDEALSQFQTGPARVLLDFVAASKRGICSDVGLHAPEGSSEEQENADE